MKNKLLLALTTISLTVISLVSCTVAPQSSQGNSENTSQNGSQTSSTINLYPDAEIIQGYYSNPLQVTYRNGTPYTIEIADPTVVRGDDGLFYCFSTNQRALVSEDGCTWTVHSDNIIPRPTWGDSYHGGEYKNLWAPDCVKIGDKWIYYYSLSCWSAPVGVGYAVADSCGGPYVDQGKLFDGDEMGIKNCIDPQVFVDDDGKVYLTVGSFQGLYLMELEDDGMSLRGGVETQKTNKELIAGYNGDWDGATYEGGYITKRGDYYYYFGSAGTCCAGKDSTYQVYVGKSADIWGPYVGKDGIEMTKSRGSKTYGELVVQAPMSQRENYAGVGHNSILIDDVGDYWIYYHGYSKVDSFRTRHLFMDKLIWDEQGYPSVEKKRPSFEEEKAGPIFLV